MKVYIYARPANTSRHAGIFAAEIETLTGKPLERSEFKQARKNGVYIGTVTNAEMSDEENPKKDNKTKAKNRTISFYIDPALGFTPAEIVDDFWFGNTATVGSVLLKDGEAVKCSWIVIDKANQAAFNSKIAQIKTKCEQ